MQIILCWKLELHNACLTEDPFFFRTKLKIEKRISHPRTVNLNVMREGNNANATSPNQSPKKNYCAYFDIARNLAP